MHFSERYSRWACDEYICLYCQQYLCRQMLNRVSVLICRFFANRVNLFKYKLFYGWHDCRVIWNQIIVFLKASYLTVFCHWHCAGISVMHVVWHLVSAVLYKFELFSTFSHGLDYCQILLAAKSNPYLQPVTIFIMQSCELEPSEFGL